MSMLSDVGVFLVAVISHWQSYITGGAVTALIYIFERLTDWKMPKWAFAAVFLGVFLLVSFFLVWKEQYSLANQIPTLQAQLRDKDREIQNLKDKPSQVQVNVPAPIVNISPQMAYMTSADIAVIRDTYKIGGKFAVSATCKNISQSIVAENVACVSKLVIADTTLNVYKQPVVAEAEQERAYRQFQKDFSSIKVTRRSYGPGESAFSTTFSPTIDEQLDAAFRSGSKTIVFLADYNWEDGAGKHSHEICGWLQLSPTIFSGRGAIVDNAAITWNNCTKHNGLRK